MNTIYAWSHLVYLYITTVYLNELHTPEYLIRSYNLENGTSMCDRLCVQGTWVCNLK